MTIQLPGPELHASIAEVRRAAGSLADARTRAMRDVTTSDATVASSLDGLTKRLS